jgi:hypothetical protein
MWSIQYRSYRIFQIMFSRIFRNITSDLQLMTHSAMRLDILYFIDYEAQQSITANA